MRAPDENVPPISGEYHARSDGSPGAAPFRPVDEGDHEGIRGAEGGVVVEHLDEPPGVGELIDMRSTSVCASDLMYIGYGLKRILGHELAGVREDGTPVVVEALYGCMECELCLSGAYNLCPTHAQRALGATADGGMAEQFRAPSARLVPLPAGLDVRDASIVEPASVSWHALRPRQHRAGHEGGHRRRRSARAARRGRCPPHGRRPTSPSRPVTRISARPASVSARRSAPTACTTS